MLSKSPMFRISHSLRALFLVGGALLVPLAGCGGGGGGGVSTPTATPTPIPTSTPLPSGAIPSVTAGCNSTTYAPNYYGLPDPSVAPSDSTAGNYTFWTHFPISVYIGATTDANRAATIAGFNQWVTATGGRVSYQLVNTPTNTDLVVSYSPQDPNSTTLGLTTVYYYQSNNTIASAKMQLFFYTPSQLSNASAANQSIAAHEFGHALGIGAHSPNPTDLMYPYLDPANGSEPISTRDLNTLKTIYCNNFPTRSTASVKPSGPVVTRTLPPLKRK